MALAEGTQHHIVRQVHGANQAHAQPVFRDEGQANAQTCNGRGVLSDELLFPAIILHIADGAGLGGLQTRNGLQKLFLTAAGNTGNAQNLPGIGGEGHIVQLEGTLHVLHGQMLYHNAGLGIHGGRTVNVQRHRTSNHHIGHLLGVGFPCEHIAHELAVAQDGHPIGQVLHLVHLVGDDDDGLAVVAHIAQDLEELFRLLGGQHSSGLVQNQNIRPAIEDLHDLHRLLLGNGHIVDLLVGVHVEAVGIANLLHFGSDLIHIQPSGLLQAQDDILRSGEHIHQLEVLMNHANAIGKGILGGTDQRLLAIDENPALIGKIDAGEHIHERCLAAAVFPQQSQNFALVDVQPHPVIGQHRAKPFGNVPHLHSGFLFFQKDHSFSDGEMSQRATRRKHHCAALCSISRSPDWGPWI